MSDFVEYFLADEQTRAIGMYVEPVRDGRRLFDRLRAARARKPMVILKGGRTPEGLVAAAPHTGALGGSDRAWRALEQQTGCVLAEIKLPPGCSIANPVNIPGGNFRKDSGAATSILDAINRLDRPQAPVMHLNMTVFKGHAQAGTLDMLVEAALRVKASHPGRSHFVLVLRSDGDPDLEEQRRQFRARAKASGIPVFDELTNAGTALAAVSRVERFVHTRNAS